MLLLWCLPLPERCVLLLLGALCVRTVFYVAEMVLFVAETPAGTHEGSDVKPVFCVAGLSGCINKSAGRQNCMVVEGKD